MKKLLSLVLFIIAIFAIPSSVHAINWGAYDFHVRRGCSNHYSESDPTTAFSFKEGSLQKIAPGEQGIFVIFAGASRICYETYFEVYVDGKPWHLGMLWNGSRVFSIFSGRNGGVGERKMVVVKKIFQLKDYTILCNCKNKPPLIVETWSFEVTFCDNKFCSSCP